MTANWGGEPEVVRLGHDLPRIFYIDGEYVKHSRGDLREEALGYIPGATRDHRADLRQATLAEQARTPAPAKPPREITPRMAKWFAVACFIAIVAVQCAVNYRPGFQPRAVPISTITTPYSCGLGGEVTGVVLESPGVDQSSNIYAVTCASGEVTSVFQR